MCLCAKSKCILPLGTTTTAAFAIALLRSLLAAYKVRIRADADTNYHASVPRQLAVNRIKEHRSRKCYSTEALRFTPKSVEPRAITKPEKALVLPPPEIIGLLLAKPASPGLLRNKAPVQSRFVSKSKALV